MFILCDRIVIFVIAESKAIEVPNNMSYGNWLQCQCYIHINTYLNVAYMHLEKTYKRTEQGERNS